MDHVGEKSIPGRGRWTQVVGSKELPLATLQHSERSMGERPTNCFMLHAKDRTHQRYPQEENKEAMQENLPQEGITDSPPRHGASKETDTGINQNLSMAGVGEGPIGNCIVGEPGNRTDLERRYGRPDSEWQDRPYILFSRPTQDSPQSEGTRGKGIGGTYAEGKPTRH